MAPLRLRSNGVGVNGRIDASINSDSIGAESEGSHAVEGTRGGEFPIGGEEPENLPPNSPTFGGYNPFNHHVPSPDIFEDNNAQDEWRNDYPDYSGGGQPWSPQADTQPIHDARRELFPDSPTEGEGQLFTFIYRGQTPQFDRHTKVNCIYVDHEDHYHFVFESSNHNKSRTMQRIIQAGHLDVHQNIPILSTLQPVINWDRFAAYLVRANSLTVCIGQKLLHYATNLKVIPREQRDCATLLRNDRATKTKFDNLKRKRRIDLMSELVEQSDTRTLNELKNALTYEDRKNLYAEHGQQWKEAAELCIEAYCEKLRREQESALFQHYIHHNNHTRICQHPRDLTRGLIWLDNLLTQNNIKKDDFLGDLTKVMNKTETRRNAFVIEGPTTTGKSLMLKLICDNYIYGTVQRSGDHSQFFLMNLINKSIALMEEPRITSLTVNDFKELLGGTPFDIHVKHQKDERLPRIPVLISTNNDLTFYCLSEDAKTIKARCFTYKFYVPIPSPELPLPPCTMCPCYFSAWYKNWLN
ncbi:uncharacterized protein DEA37_0004282, partial [Paragonimus westermani]